MSAGHAQPLCRPCLRQIRSDSKTGPGRLDVSVNKQSVASAEITKGLRSLPQWVGGALVQNVKSGSHGLLMESSHDCQDQCPPGTIEVTSEGSFK